MSAKGIRAGGAFVELSADSNPLSRGLALAAKKMKAWGAGLNALGASVASVGLLDLTKGLAGLAGLGFAAKTFIDVAGALDDMSERTGISVESLSALTFAAEQAGATVEDLESGIKLMQKGLAASDSGFAKLGLSAGELTKLAPDEAFAKVADRMAAIQNPTKRAALAMDIFGKAGTKLLPLLSGGAEGLAAMKQEAEDAGVIIGGPAAAAADALGKAWDKLKKQFQAVVVAIGSALAPLLQDFTKWLTPILKNTIDWIKENKGLVITFLKLSALSVGLGASLVVLGGVIKGLGLAFAGLGIAAVVLKGIVAAFGLLLSPIGLVVAAVAGLGTALVLLADNGETVKSSFASSWQDIKSTAISAWQGIVDAVMSGDLELAGKIAWAGLKLLFHEGVDFFIGLWQSASIKTQKVLSLIWAGAEMSFVSATATISQVWDTMIMGLKLSWIGLVEAVKGAWIEISSLFSTDDARNKARQELAAEIANRRADVMGEGASSIANTEKEKQAKLAALAAEAAEREKILNDMQAREAAGRMKGLEDEKAALAALVDEAAKKRAEQQAAVAGAATNTQKAAGVAAPLGETAASFSGAGALRFAGAASAREREIGLLQQAVDRLGELLAEQRENGGRLVLG